MAAPTAGQAVSPRHALVVGATGVLGAAIARSLAAEGVALSLTGRRQDRLDELSAELGDRVLGTTVLDLADPQAPARAVTGAAGRQGLDLLVIASGVVAFGSVEELDDDDLDELFLVNTLGPARVLRAAVPVLGEGSTVVLLSAIVADRPTAGMAAYSASKAALTAFGRALQHELRRRRIRVLDVRPPHTETGLAGRPVAGTAPALGTGKDPQAVADRVVRAIIDGERDLPADAFA